MQSGTPENPEAFTLVSLGEKNIYVPKDKEYEGDIPRIVRFQKRNGDIRSGVNNELN